jgi:hypothetical protein
MLELEPQPQRIAPRGAEAVGAEDVAAFLAGYGSGSQVLGALYDHLLLEPVPRRMIALIRRCKLHASGTPDAVEEPSSSP